MGSVPLGVPCPLTSSMGEFLGYWDWLWYPGLSSVFLSIAFPFAFHILVFFYSLFFPCHWISFVILLYGRRICTHSVDLSLIHFLGEFQAWDWLWYPMLWSQRQNRGAHGAEISIQMSALAGVELRTLASIAPPPFSRLLRHVGGYS